MARYQRLSAWALAAGAWLAAAQVSAAPTLGAEFPASLEPAAITAWVKHNTDLDPATVIALTPQAVMGVLSSISTPEGPTIRQVNLRSESISRADFEQRKLLSWTSVIEVDCKTRKARLGRTMAYAERNLIGEGRQIVAASPAWIAPLAGGPAHSVMLKVCDGKTINPLTGAGAGAGVPVAHDPPAVKAPLGGPKPKLPPAPGVTAAARPGRVLVQIAAVRSEADARRVLAAAQSRRPPPAGVAARTAKKGVRDNDQIVTGALGEPIPGAIADATDGELK